MADILHIRSGMPHKGACACKNHGRVPQGPWVAPGRNINAIRPRSPNRPQMPHSELRLVLIKLLFRFYGFSGRARLLVARSSGLAHWSESDPVRPIRGYGFVSSTYPCYSHPLNLPKVYTTSHSLQVRVSAETASILPCCD